MNPKFNDATNGDFSLQKCSPAIDKGESRCLLDNLDLNGENRLYNASVETNNQPIVDLGAFEFRGSYQSNCDCPNQYLSTGITSTATYRALENITSEAIVQPGEKLILGANNSVILQPPFETQSNVVFEANTMGCSN